MSHFNTLKTMSLLWRNGRSSEPEFGAFRPFCRALLGSPVCHTQIVPRAPCQPNRSTSTGTRAQASLGTTKERRYLDMQSGEESQLGKQAQRRGEKPKDWAPHLESLMYAASGEIGSRSFARISEILCSALTGMARTYSLCRGERIAGVGVTRISMVDLPERTIS
jgi:hypothetical protein